jgi:hypothetical protein
MVKLQHVGKNKLSMKKVVVLTGNSLLAQGMVSRLRQYSRLLELLEVDLATPNSLRQVSEFQPEIIIFDESDFTDSRQTLFVNLLNTIPDAILVELRMENPNVQMIQSVRYTASSADELVQLFKSSESTPGLPPALLR